MKRLHPADLSKTLCFSSWIRLVFRVFEACALATRGLNGPQLIHLMIHLSNHFSKLTDLVVKRAVESELGTHEVSFGNTNSYSGGQIVV